MKSHKAKILILSLLLLFFIKPVDAQLITTQPAFPTVYDTITITFDATKGNEGLKDFTGDVYAHTGVIIESSSNWEHVIAGWTENIPKAKLTRSSTNDNILKQDGIQAEEIFLLMFINQV